MADKKRKHSGRSHLTKEAWSRLNTVAFSKKVARFSTYPDGENGNIIVVEHIDPRCYPRVMPLSWPDYHERTSGRTNESA